MQGKQILQQVEKTSERPRAGRPTRLQAGQRHEELLHCALDMFLERGFEQATVDDIAVSVGMSKRTVYSLYADKSALFEAAIWKAIEFYKVPMERLRAVESADLRETLIAVAHIRIHNVMTPSTIKLQRIMAAQSHRFPVLFHAAFEEAAGATLDFLSKLFASRTASGEINIPEPRRAALAFLSLVVGAPARIIVAGAQVDEDEFAAQVHFAVGVFLDGVRPR